MIVHGAFPVNCWARVRGWTVMASTPSASAIVATSTAFRCVSSQPPRILTVSGTRIAARMARRIRAAAGTSRMSAAPLPLPVILWTGQPMLRSTTSAPRASQRAAASASASAFLPRSCIASGRSAG